jgi:hypothetical protein
MSDYYEIILDGDAEILRGFVVGYLAATGLGSQVFVCRDFHIEHDSLAHQLGEWIGLLENRTHLIVPSAANDQIRAGVQEAGDELKIEVHASRRLARARFDFEWETYNRDEASELRAFFDSHPASVSLDDYSPEEIIHEDEEGQISGYAPTHPYTARARGHAHGDPGALIEWAAALRDQDFVKVGTIQLEYAD